MSDERREVALAGFAEVLRNLMDARGYTQAELVRRSGISNAQISELLGGTSKNPTQRTLERLANAFDLDVATLMALTSRTLPSAVNELRIEGVPGEALLRLAVMWSDLTSEDREAVIDLTRRIWEGRVAQRGQATDGPQGVGEA